MTESGSSTPATANLAGMYRPIAELGRGGMATVYLVLAQGPGGFNKLQVVKLLHPELASDAEFVNMFLQEARLVARLNHPNVVQTYDVGFDGKSYGIVMEYVEGQSFESIIRRGEKNAKTAGEGAKMPVAMQIRILIEMLSGLGYAHDLTDFDGKPLQLVHRDVTPHNVIVGYDGHVKLVDFGIAKAADSNGQTRAGVIKGKVAYMAPEQFGGGKIDRRTDLFAVGIMLWQIATRQRMWRGLNETEIFKKLAAKAIPTARSVNPEVPEALEAICTKALQFHPDDRYQTAAEFQRALEEYAAKSERCTPQQVGAWIGTTFADARAKVKAAIEQRTKKGVGPSNGPIDEGSKEISPFSSQSVSITNISTTDNTGSKSAKTENPAANARGRLAFGGWPYVVSAALLLGLSVYAFVAARRAQEKPVVAEQPAPKNEPDETRITIDVTPADAKVFLDDLPLTERTVARPRDGLSHRVRAAAPGYVAAGQLIAFDSSLVTVALVLEQEHTPTGAKPPVANAPHGGYGSPTQARTTKGGPSAAASAPHVPPPGPTAAPPAPAPAPTAPGKPSIDTQDDPWRQHPKK
jgi:eukaryotic-like serine/threonine-protein kinase